MGYLYPGPLEVVSRAGEYHRYQVEKRELLIVLSNQLRKGLKIMDVRTH